MPPRTRKNSAAAAGPAAPRRSARLASREPSVTSTDENRDTVVRKKQWTKTTALPSKTQLELPMPKNGKRPRVKEEEGETTTAKKRKIPLKTAEPWDADRVARRVVYGDSIEMIAQLTESQCKAVCNSLATQNRNYAHEIDELKHEMEVVTEELEEARRRPKVTRLQRDFTLKHIEEQHRQALAEEQARNAALEKKTTESTTSSPVTTRALSRSQSHKPSASASPNTSVTTSSPALAITASMISEDRTSPVSTLRAESTPRSPAVTVFTPAAAPATAPSAWRRFVGYFGSPFIGSRKRSADDADQPPQKRVRIEHSTPKISHHDQKRSGTTVPSSKNPKEPTSLSTITEFTENSTFSRAPDSTPSRPSRNAATIQGSSIKLPNVTPARQTTTTSTMETAQSAPPKSLAQPTPSTNDTTQQPVQRNRPWSQHVKREAERRRRTLNTGSTSANKDRLSTSTLGGTQTPSSTTSWGRLPVDPASGFNFNPSRPWSWETKSDTPHRAPMLKNADERHAKLQRFRDLQRQLQELSNDTDIVDIMSHRSKRVKVDHLSSIPHNLPGDSQSTFRVPDIDSDGEMDVAELVDVRENLFTIDEEMLDKEEEEKRREQLRASQQQQQQQKEKEQASSAAPASPSKRVSFSPTKKTAFAPATTTKQTAFAPSSQQNISSSSSSKTLASNSTLTTSTSEISTPAPQQQQQQQQQKGKRKASEIGVGEAEDLRFEYPTVGLRSGGSPPLSPTFIARAVEGFEEACAGWLAADEQEQQEEYEQEQDVDVVL